MSKRGKVTLENARCVGETHENLATWQDRPRRILHVMLTKAMVGLRLVNRRLTTARGDRDDRFVTVGWQPGFHRNTRQALDGDRVFQTGGPVAVDELRHEGIVKPQMFARFPLQEPAAMHPIL
jgi:hypothetical protein